MKQLEDMTLREIEELKKQYMKELAECLEDFFKNRPLIKHVALYRSSSIGSPSCILLFPDEDQSRIVSSVEFIKESK